MDTMIAQMLGHYEIVAQIGQGAMGTVYRARHMSVGREVAIKMLRPDLVEQDRTTLERFNREVQVITGLQHPHIVPVYDYGEVEGVPYIVMAHIGGGSLEDHLVPGEPLSIDSTIRILRQISDALDYAHSRDVIHRDLKPGNVLFDDNGNLYLADFGLAKIGGSSKITASDGILGTPAYMAPDWSAAEDVTYSVDLYSLGVMLYEMLAGQPPYQAATPMAVLMMHTSGPIPNLNQRRPDISPAVAAVVSQAMAKTPQDRFQSAREMVAQLHQAAHATTEMPKATRQKPQPEPQQYFYPNMWGRSMFVAAERALSAEALMGLLVTANLPQYIEAFPPDDMRREFPFEHFGALNSAIYEVYGRRGAQAVGRAAAEYTLEDVLGRWREIAKMGLAVTRAAPATTRVWVGLSYMVRTFNNVSDQITEIEDTERYWVYRIMRCPVCWGVHTDEPVCYIAAGLLAATMEWMFSIRPRITETECIAKGDPACVFLIEKQSIE